MLSLKPFSKSITKKKPVLIVTIILVVIFAVFTLIVRFQNTAKKADASYKALPATAPHSQSTLLVRFKDIYNPYYLQKDIDRRQDLKRTLGTLHQMDDAWNSITNDVNPEATLAKINSDLQKLGVSSFRKMDKQDIKELNASFILYLSEGTTVRALQEDLQKTGYFDQSEPNFKMELFAAPNDPSYSQLWGMEKIEAPLAWDVVTGDKNIVVAVIDSGIDMSHPDLQANTVAGHNFLGGGVEDGLGHGSHVSGTVGAIGNNNTGVAGVNWAVSIMPLQVFDASGQTDSSYIYEAISYAANNNVDVINMSLGNSSGFLPCTTDTEYSRRTKYAASKGIVIVAAAGNENTSAEGKTPASCADAIAVGASTQGDTRAPFSNFGPEVDIAAPGTQIYSTYPGGYRSNQGTSMASPHVAGAAALLLAAKNSLSPDEVKECLISSGDPITTDRPIGGVRLNINKALQTCGGSSGPRPTATPTLSPTPTPTPGPGAPPTPTPVSGGSGGARINVTSICEGDKAQFQIDYDVTHPPGVVIETIDIDGSQPVVVDMSTTTVVVTPIRGKGTYISKGNNLSPPNSGLKKNTRYRIEVHTAEMGTTNSFMFSLDATTTDCTKAPTPTPTSPPGSGPTATLAPTSAVFKPPANPTPTPKEYFTCSPDPKCSQSTKTIKLCPLICTPKQ